MNSREGSVLLLVIFICAAMAALLIATSTAIMVGEQAHLDERDGRETLLGLEHSLHEEAARRAGAWESDAPTVDPPSPQLTVASVDSSEAWTGRLTLTAASSTREGGYRSLEGEVERGRDGLDLPLAGLVAGSLSASAPRADGVASSSAGDPAAVFLTSVGGWAGVLTEALVEAIDSPWALDEGTLARISDGGPEALAPGVFVLNIPAGQTMRLGEILPAGTQAVTIVSPSGDPFAPTGAYLVVAVGEGTLDARGLGNLFAVLVCSGGSVQLDGTVLHGAAFATGEIDLGESGRIVFDRPILRWATDRSLVQTRLVPGSRREASTPDDGVSNPG